MTPVTGTSLTLQAALRSAAARVGLGGAARSLAGLSASAKGLAAAAAAAEAPVVVIVPGAGDVEQLVADTRFFLGSLTAASEHELRHHVLAFPSHEVDPYRGLAPHFDVAAARGRALHGLASGTVRVVVAASAALLPRVSAPDRLLAAGTRLVEGAFLEPPDLGDLLADAGFVPEDPVDGHGQFCVRGGVVDFFPAGDEHPIRAEFAGDSLESLRRFDPATQRSTETLDQVEVFPLRELFEPAPGGGPQDGEPDRSAWLRDYLRRVPGVRVYLSESEASRAAAASRLEQAAGSFAEAEAQGEAVPAPEELLVAGPVLDDWLASVPRLEQLWEDQDTAPAAHHVACQPVVEMHGRIGDWAAEIARCRERGDTTLLVAGTPGRAERVIELLADYDLTALSIDHADETHGAALLVATGQLTRGFRLPDAGLQIFAEPDVFDEERRVRERRAGPARSFLSDFRDLKAGDRVVHVDHGVGVFVGLKQIPVGLERHEFMELRYAGEDKLFVPVQQIDLLQKYSGTGKNLDRLGGTSWAKTKTRVRRAMRDMAEELLKLYAARKAMPGHTFSADSHWHREFDDAFEYQLTTDQQSAIEDIRRDMESPVSMDRLLCGDVGYGKTEVAMRAAFKAVMDGKQVGFLAPTTVLAFQHHKTLSDRFAAFPVRIDLVSRFRTRAEQKQTLTDLEAGRVDIIVGTHRLLSKDVRFSDLGLLVVDEEQRFGVAHKERIKQLRRRVDVLTMTATPIPRTLNMSLAGIRDMSVIETPPKDRQSIQTNVVRFDQPLIARAIRTELERGGQVYFLHSRVTSIYAMGELLTRLLPEARIAVAHGQMEEGALERCMVDFVRHQYDVLLATTIIENGLDIPNANTIIVNHAERFGLAQLYQLRGRVGRSDRRAYAYLLVPPEGSLSPVARRRLAAIREFSDLGSGFRVAALDLEIRGAGNLLGGEQSGHIESVGFDMYVKLLDQTVRELKGEEVEEAARAAVNLDVDLKIDEDYIPDTNQRLTVYRRVASARGEAELSALADELRDRYGPVPASIGVLVEYGRIRLLADELGLESIDRNDARLVLKFRTTTPVDPVRLMRFVERRRDLELKPPAMLTADLRARGAARGPRDSPSWWTARARSGEVEAGFSRAEFQQARRDREGPAPLLDRVGSLLVELRGLQAVES